MGGCWAEGTEFQLCRVSKSGDPMYSTMSIVNNAVSYTGNFLREQISPHTQKANYMRRSIC